MGLGIYGQSLLLFTNASEDLITKSEAREGVLYYKTYTVHQNKRNSRKPPNNGLWTFILSCPLYEGSTVLIFKDRNNETLIHIRGLILILKKCKILNLV